MVPSAALDPVADAKRPTRLIREDRVGRFGGARADGRAGML
jgi:hypothetical protein